MWKLCMLNFKAPIWVKTSLGLHSMLCDYPQFLRLWSLWRLWLCAQLTCLLLSVVRSPRNLYVMKSCPCATMNGPTEHLLQLIVHGSHIKRFCFDQTMQNSTLIHRLAFIETFHTFSVFCEWKWKVMSFCLSNIISVAHVCIWSTATNPSPS